MGVNPIMKNYYTNNNLMSIIYRYFYSSPFNLIIGTQDGSGIEFWFKKALNKNSNKQLLINGVEKSIVKNTRKKFNNNKKMKVCFIGKLEKSKGAELFMEAAIKYLNDSRNIIFYMIGSGSLYSKLKNKINIKNLEKHFKLIQYLEHKKVYKFLSEIDIYVSLNKYGNLSNTNLEAISLNKVMIILDSDKKSKTDIFVDSFLPKTLFTELIEMILLIV